MKLKWTKGQRGHAARTSVCGRYICEIVEYGCRHDPGPWWDARLARVDPKGMAVWLDSNGRVDPRHSLVGGPLREAKESAQAHADKAAP